MSDYNFLMESRLSPEQFQVLNHLSRIAAERGLNLYLVGGAVRDLTYGQQIVRDLDFAVEGNPQRIFRRLSSSRSVVSSPAGLGAFASAAESWGVAHLGFNARLNAAEISFTNGVRAELAMCRNEVYTKPGRRPEIFPATIFEDLRRRDFSVNAMAISLHPNSRGLLLDPTNGAADIEKRELRVLRNHSFLEDPSRIYRLLRLGLRLDFKPDAKTTNLVESALKNRAWERLEPEQQRRELRAVLQEDQPGRVLKMLAQRGLLTGLSRKLALARIPYELFAKIRSVAQTVPRADPFLLHFHCLIQKLGPSHARRLAGKIIADRKAIVTALRLKSDAQKVARTLASSRAALPSQVYTLLSKQPQSLLLFLLVHYRQAKIHSRVKNFLCKYPLVRAKLPRAELQAMGLKPGPQFEKIIEQVFLEQLDGKIKTHQQLLKELRTLAGIKEPSPKPSKLVAGARPRKK